MKSSKKLIAAAVAGIAMFASSAPQAADQHTINVNATVTGTCKFIGAASGGTSNINMTLDPTLTTTVTGSSTIVYRCTNGTAPIFTFTSSAGAGTGTGTLSNGGDNIAYTYTSTNDGAGAGMGTGNDKNVSVTVSVDQTNAANVPAGLYTDTIDGDLSN